MTRVLVNKEVSTVKKQMPKVKKKLTAAQKRARKKAKEERQKKYMWVFMNGKQVRVKRPETIDGMEVDEFIVNNSDPISLHQNEMWEYMECEDTTESYQLQYESDAKNNQEKEDEEIPF